MKTLNFHLNNYSSSDLSRLLCIKIGVITNQIKIPSNTNKDNKPNVSNAIFIPESIYNINYFNASPI